AVSMNVTSNSTARLSAAFAVSRSGGSPQMPGPVIRIAPKPSRLTVRSPPTSMVPAFAAVIWLFMGSPFGGGSCCWWGRWQRETQVRRDNVVHELGAGLDMLDRAAFIDHRLRQLIDDVGCVPRRFAAQRADVSSERQPSRLVTDHARSGHPLLHQQGLDRGYRARPQAAAQPERGELARRGLFEHLGDQA